MNEPMMQVIQEMTQRAHALRKGHAAELAGAANHREHGDYTRAAIAEHAAGMCAAKAAIYEEIAGVVSGTWLPSPDQLSEPAEGLGVGVGIVRWAPPQDASPAQLHQWRAFCDELQQSGIRQKYRTDDLLPAANATQVTGQIAPEDLPQPDALSASPAEETGSHAAVLSPAGPPPGFAGFHAEPTAEPEPAPEAAEDPAPEAPADPKPETARRGIHRIKSGRKRSHPAAPKSEAQSTGYQHLLGKRVVVATTDGRRSHGVLDIADGALLVLHPSEDGYPEIPRGLVVSVTALPPRAEAGIYQQAGDELVNTVTGLPTSRSYPDAPANGARPAVDPAQARMDELAAQRREDDPSALGEVTQAFPPPAAEPVIDPDCKADKCGSCVGGPCEHSCHQATAQGGGAS